MSRIQMVDPENAPSEVQPAYDTLIGLLGRVSHMFRTAARWSPVIGDMVVFGSHFLANAPGSNLDPRLKRLVHLRASVVNGCEYCTIHNSGWAEAQGVSPADLGLIRGGKYETSETLSPEVKAALAWTDSVSKRTAKDDDATYNRLVEHYSPEQVVELTLAIAYRSMINTFVDALAVEVEQTKVPEGFAVLSPERVGVVQDSARAARPASETSVAR